MDNMFQNTVARHAYTSAGGSDIIAVIGNKEIGTLQSISYSVQREKGPIYVMNGSPEAVSMARGKRMIGGSMILITLDEQALFQHLKRTAGGEGDKFYANKHDVRYSYGEGNNIENAFGLFEAAVNEEYEFLKPGEQRELAHAWYPDQVLPFDVNITASTEYGGASKKSIIGVEIMNEGGGVSVDDLAMEEVYQFVARSTTPWTTILKPGQRKV